MTVNKSSVSRGVGDMVCAATVLAALRDPVLVVDTADHIESVNPAAEEFLQSSAALLSGRPLADLFPFGSPVMSVIAQARRNQSSVSEFYLDIDSPAVGRQSVNILVSPIPEAADKLVARLDVRSIASKLDRQFTHRGATRSVAAMAAMMAHEVKNPLSSIRAAAQLLDQGVTPQDRELTQLILAETDRVCRLLERMDVLSDPRPSPRSGVNIHQVLEHVRKLVQTGVANNVHITECYDPSLPLVYGNKDQLIQVFLNLVKNAAEALEPIGGEITLTTAFRPGVRLAMPGSDKRVQLGLEIIIADNGPGIDDDLWPHLFEPYVTTKADGNGLGLALVAKIVADHGGIIEAEKGGKGGKFRVNLPIFKTTDELDSQVK